MAHYIIWTPIEYGPSIRILYNRKWTPIDYGPGFVFYGGPCSKIHIGYGRGRIWTPGSKFYDGDPYYIIEYGPPGPYSMGSIFYMTWHDICGV